eukprot:768799-Hanusia_phi.AAC.12
MLPSAASGAFCCAAGSGAAADVSQDLELGPHPPHVSWPMGGASSFNHCRLLLLLLQLLAATACRRSSSFHVFQLEPRGTYKKVMDFSCSSKWFAVTGWQIKECREMPVGEALEEIFNEANPRQVRAES